MTTVTVMLRCWRQWWWWRKCIDDDTSTSTTLKELWCYLGV